MYKPVYVVEHEEIYKGYHLMVVFFRAWRCGYVGFKNDKNIVLATMNDNNQLDVYGDISYDTDYYYLEDMQVKKLPNMKDDFDRYIGFACDNYGINQDYESAKKYGASDYDLRVIKELYIDKWEKAKDKDFVLNELKELVEQLEKLRGNNE